ncbi:MAG: C40 family peptidase [Alphaproteobacteria bacterium]|nr:C40 family peptidase [Alphaproteobacteria bacterium]
MYDPRFTPARADIAARYLEGEIAAERFVDGWAAQVTASSAPLRRTPSPEAGLETELLHGEPFHVYDEADGWAWGQAGIDDYVGFVPLACLAAAPALRAPSHRVSALRTFVYPEADLKRPVRLSLSLGAKLRVAEIEGRWARLEEGGFVFAPHLVPARDRAADFVAVAERFIGVPYLWGGRSSLGLDCSALVQLSLEAAGYPAPRDSDVQEADLGRELPIEGGALPALERGDLVFWKGHVAIMIDPVRIIHANATHMAVSVNRLEEFARRVEPSTGPLTSVRRLALG